MSQLKLCYFVLALFCIVADGERELPTEFDDEIIGSEKGAIHVVTSTECYNSYFVYQSLALNYTFNKVGQPGKLTRVLSCPEDSLHERVSEEDLQIMDTLVVPSWTRHPRNGDYYQPYNRPVSLIFWLAERKPTAEWTLIIDPDMMFKQPLYPEYFNLPEGFAASSHYNYLDGVNNALADRHIPNIPRKQDLYGGPKGRRADQSGAFMLMRTRDLIRVAPLWLKFTEAVREDKNAWNLTGDTQVKKGQKAWISEMYGYVFAAAEAGIRHKIEVATQYYPKYTVKDIPILIHYGLAHKLKGFIFDKHLHFEFESFKCPPWNMSTMRTDEQDYGLFPHPPRPDSLKTYRPRNLYSELLVIDFVNTINKALCERHGLKCPESEDLKTQCGIVDEIEEQLEEAYKPLHLSGVLCHDDEDHCTYWKRKGECEKTWMYMTEHCRASCEKCRLYVSPEEAKIRLQNQTISAETVLVNKEAELTGGIEMMKEITELAKQKCTNAPQKDWTEDPICRRLILEGLINVEEARLNNLRVIEASMNKEKLEGPSGVYVSVLVLITAILLIIIWFSKRRNLKKYDSKQKN